MIFTTEQMMGFPAMVGFPEAKMAKCDSSWLKKNLLSFVYLIFYLFYSV